MWANQDVIYWCQENMGLIAWICLKNILVNSVESGHFFAISSDEILDVSTTQNIVRENTQMGLNEVGFGPQVCAPFKTRCQKDFFLPVLGFVSSVTGREHPTICSAVHKPNTIAMDISHYAIEPGINGIEIFGSQGLLLERWKIVG
jgi:hypothetical protein